MPEPRAARERRRAAIASGARVQRRRRARGGSDASGAGDRVEQQRSIGDRARERTVRVEVRPRRNHAGARHEAERRLHPDDAGELRRNAIRSAVVGAERGERHAARDGDRRAGARSARRLRARRVVRIAHLSGELLVPLPRYAKSSAAVLPSTTAPAARMRATSSASRCTGSGKSLAHSALEPVVGSPFMS